MKLEVKTLHDHRAKSIVDRSHFVNNKDGSLVFLMPDDYNEVLNNSALVKCIAIHANAKKNCIVYPDHKEISKRIFKTGPGQQ